MAGRRPPQPATSWAFLQQQRLLASSRLETFVALVGWGRNLTHFAGPVSRQNFREHWGYDGDMPVARALTGTRYTGTVFASMPGYDAVRHYTAGCQGTAGLFASVLRAANIPVRLRSGQQRQHAARDDSLPERRSRAVAWRRPLLAAQRGRPRRPTC